MKFIRRAIYFPLAGFGMLTIAVGVGIVTTAMFVA